MPPSAVVGRQSSVPLAHNGRSNDPVSRRLDLQLLSIVAKVTGREDPRISEVLLKVAPQERQQARNAASLLGRTTANATAQEASCDPPPPPGPTRLSDYEVFLECSIMRRETVDATRSE